MFLPQSSQLLLSSSFPLFSSFFLSHGFPSPSCLSLLLLSLSVILSMTVDLGLVKVLPSIWNSYAIPPSFFCHPSILLLAIIVVVTFCLRFHLLWNVMMLYPFSFGNALLIQLMNCSWVATHTFFVVTDTQGYYNIDPNFRLELQKLCMCW